MFWAPLRSASKVKQNCCLCYTYLSIDPIHVLSSQRGSQRQRSKNQSFIFVSVNTTTTTTTMGCMLHNKIASLWLSVDKATFCLNYVLMLWHIHKMTSKENPDAIEVDTSKIILLYVLILFATIVKFEFYPQ